MPCDGKKHFSRVHGDAYWIFGSRSLQQADAEALATVHMHIIRLVLKDAVILAKCVYIVRPCRSGRFDEALCSHANDHLNM